MRGIWTAILMVTMLVSAPALAEYPDDCLGDGEVSAVDCGDVSFEGCCDDLGRVIWCDGGLYCIDCVESDGVCGWNEGALFYGCNAEATGEDPSGDNPLQCVNCDPPCGDGEKCVNGVCEICTPDCTDMECGGDGCGGSCGECVEGDCEAGTCVICEPDCAGKLCGDDGCGGSCGECTGECVAGLCHAGPGCEVDAEQAPFCGGCGCEECVCAMDPYCCGEEDGQGWWDSLCVGECIEQCGGCAVIESCGDGTCDGVETCSNCPDDCGCANGGICFAGECCTPWCGGSNCGDDGCGGSCGECVEGEDCMSGVCLAPLDGPGCVPTVDGEGAGVAGCGGCDCEACVCEMDPFCCGNDEAGSGYWDSICVAECTECGSCLPEAECGNALCEPSEDCGTCAEDCTCAPGWTCEDAVCVDPGGCVGDCEGKECGSDGCGGSCGACEDGFVCGGGDTCVEDTCEADCVGKDCGDDGCGGSCGECADGEECSMAGLCGEICVPDCEGKECGDDGCEGSCGVCDAGECTDGVCMAAEECGNGTVEGDEVCEADGDCADGEICTDCACVAGCTPACDGKECGDDGCGGSCGACGADLVCGEAGLCAAGTTDGDVVSGDVAGDVSGEEPSSGGGSSGCSTTGASNGSALLLVLMALLGMVAIRRQEA
jgi:hypothetical protein